jgi:amidase
MVDDLAGLDAVAQAELVRSGSCTPLELVDAAIGRIEGVNSIVNAVITTRFARAREEAEALAGGEGAKRGDAPLLGVPFLVKDAVCQTAGDPYHVGMRALRDRGYVAPRDSYLATNFRDAGLVILGRTNLPELAMGPTTEPLAYGATHNPWQLEHTPGGSSGGSAAAVAAGLVPAAHGNDMGGSIRIPASFCGLVALKPTRARTSLGPQLGELWGPVTNESVLTRTVRDTAALLDAARRPWPGDPYVAPPPSRPYASEVGAEPGRLRIGVCATLPDAPVDPECRAATEIAARLLQEVGHSVEDAYPTALGEPVMAEVSSVVWGTGVRRDVERLGEALGQPIDPDELEPANQALIQAVAGVTATEYLAGLEKMYAWARRVCAWWADGFDLLLTPTTTQPPPHLGVMAPQADPDRLAAMIGALTRFVAPFNATGQPAVSLPLHWTPGGLPVGIQLVAAYGREDLLIRVASQIESARPWATRRPPVHA